MRDTSLFFAPQIIMPLTLEQLRERVVGELRSMPPGISRIAADSLYSTIARRRHLYPLGGYNVLYDVIMDVSPFWLEPSGDPISPTSREQTAFEVQDWVDWVESHVYHTAVEASRSVAPNISDEVEPDVISFSTFGPNCRSVATQTELTLIQ